MSAFAKHVLGTLALHTRHRTGHGGDTGGADDPEGYLAAIAAALREGRYDALLPTHEQAWLFAAGRHLLPADAP